MLGKDGRKWNSCLVLHDSLLDTLTFSFSFSYTFTTYLIIICLTIIKKNKQKKKTDKQDLYGPKQPKLISVLLCCSMWLFCFLLWVSLTSVYYKSWLSLTRPHKTGLWSENCFHLIINTFISTPSHAKHYWVWCVDINGGLHDSENLIVMAQRILEVALISF